MKLQEIYKTQIINNLKMLNVVLGLSTIGNPSIQEFLESSKKSYKQICKRKDDKRKAVSIIMELCSDVMVVSEDCCFYNIGILDFRSYERPDFILDFVLKFSSKDKMVEFINKDFKDFVALMSIIENDVGENIKGSLSYIVIRNFLMLCNLGMFRFAYYYACLIRTQIFISEGLNPRVEYSDLFRNQLSLSIQREHSKYRKAIAKKIRSGVINTVNKVPLVNIEEGRDKRFVGEVIETDIGSSSFTSSEVMKDKIDSVVKSNEDSIETVTVKDAIVNGSKTIIKDAGKVVGDKSKEILVKSGEEISGAIKEMSQPLVDKTKEIGGDVKDKMDEIMGVRNKNSNVEKFMEEVKNRDRNVDNKDNSEDNENIEDAYSTDAYSTDDYSTDDYLTDDYLTDRVEVKDEVKDEIRNDYKPSKAYQPSETNKPRKTDKLSETDKPSKTDKINNSNNHSHNSSSSNHNSSSSNHNSSSSGPSSSSVHNSSSSVHKSHSYNVHKRSDKLNKLREETSKVTDGISSSNMFPE